MSLNKEKALKFSRQAGYVSMNLLDKKILVIGTGAVGKNIVMMLASMGFNNISIYDFDDIEIHNCASQGWCHGDIGKPKVTALQKIVADLSTDCNLTVNNSVWRPDFIFYDYVFLAADCMNLRKNAFEYYSNRIVKPAIIDTRMRGEEMRILFSANKEQREYYKTTLFANEASADGDCTSKTTLYASNIISGLAIQKMVSHYRRGLVYKDTICNLSSGMKIET